MLTLRRYNDFFGYAVPWYSIMVGIAVAAMGLLLYLGLKRDFIRDEENKLLICFPLALAFGVVTAVLFDALFRGTWRTWGDGGTKEFGFVFFGWAVGVLGFAGIWGAVSGLGGKKLLDFFAPGLAIAQAFGRIGCFLGGCCYGCPSERFGLCYPPGSLPYEKVGPTALFPVQLVEAAVLFLLFAVCIWAPKRLRCGVYLLGVSVGRFALEYLRYDNRGEIFAQRALSPSQGVSAVLFAIGLVMLLCPARPRGKAANSALQKG